MANYPAKSFFSQDIQEELWHPHNSYKVNQHTRRKYPRTFAAYGLGWSLYDHEGHKVVTHGGAYDGMYSKVAMVPDQGLGFVILTNSMKSIGNYLAYKILDTFLDGANKDWSKMGLASYHDGVKEMNARKDAIRSKRQQGTSPHFNRFRNDGDLLR